MEETVVARSSRFAQAAYDWLCKFAPDRAVPTNELWLGLKRANPELTAITDHRKTPRTTCMRDLRTDRSNRFVVEKRTVRLAR